MKKITFLSVLFLLVCGIPSVVFAQMFSIDDADRTRFAPLTEYTVLGIAWEFGEFEYQGESLDETQRADFNNSILRIRLENPGLHFSIGLGGTITGMDETSFINLNATLFNDINVVRSRRFILSIPFQITTDLLGARRNNADTEFRQSAFSFGTGLASRINLMERVDLSVRATPNYGFSVSQGSVFGGSLFSATSKVRLFFADVIGSNALTFGYDFDYKNYDIEGDLNDYSFTSHAFTVGIGF